MLPIVLKAVHVLSSMLFLGLGLGSVFYKVRAYRRGELAVMAFCDREIVLADWLFTVPSGIVLPATGLWLATLYQLPLTTPWILAGLGGWAFAGLTWLPAAFLQIRMRTLSGLAARTGEALPPAYHRAHRVWMALGVPSFAAAMVALWAMIAKHAAF